MEIAAERTEADRDSLPASENSTARGMTRWICWTGTGRVRGWAGFCIVLRVGGEHAQLAMEMGFLISFAGNVTFPKAQACGM